MTVTILRADARALPLAAASVDLVLTSPPYWQLRDYRDAPGRSLAGQLGAEPDPAGYVAALLECTAEWVRVLKPSGTLAVNLGDKYGERTSGQARRGYVRRGPQAGRLPDRRGPREKSLLGLPWRYALAVMDELGLILRAEIIWRKGNSIPSSAADRPRREHEQLFLFTARPSYYSAWDVVREPHQPQSVARAGRARLAADRAPRTARYVPQTLDPAQGLHPLGRMIGTVWHVDTVPLILPPQLAHAACCQGRDPGCAGLGHHAAFPPDLARTVIAALSPPAVCAACGQGRFPVTVLDGEPGRRPAGSGTYRSMRPAGAKDTNLADAALRPRAIAGWACACTPSTSLGRPRRSRPAPAPAMWDGAPVAGGGFSGQARDAELLPPARVWHLDGWEPPPSRPAVVLDPLGGTGTTALVADILGRHGVTSDLSAGYAGIAAWRTADPGERARAMHVARPPAEAAGQGALFDRADLG